MHITGSANYVMWLPLIVSVLTLGGIVISLIIQNRNFKRQLISAHTLKISEMRQAWINNLRDAMCEFQSYGVTPNLDQSSQREFYAAGTKIELLMNSADKNYPQLQDLMYGYLTAKSIEEKFSLNARLVEICQIILKSEWEVLKLEIKKASR